MDGVYGAGLVLLWGLMALLVQGFRKLDAPRAGRS